jgi:hypothetical protein
MALHARQRDTERVIADVCEAGLSPATAPLVNRLKRGRRKQNRLFLPLPLFDWADSHFPIVPESER